jgi:hypothetical protein
LSQISFNLIGIKFFIPMQKQASLRRSRKPNG